MRKLLILDLEQGGGLFVGSPGGEFRRATPKRADAECAGVELLQWMGEFSKRLEGGVYTAAPLVPCAADTDGWGWESSLWFSMGERLRQGNWAPGIDTVDDSIHEMVTYAATKGVKLLAYVYPCAAASSTPPVRSCARSQSASPRTTTAVMVRSKCRRPKYFCGHAGKSRPVIAVLGVRTVRPARVSGCCTRTASATKPRVEAPALRPTGHLSAGGAGAAALQPAAALPRAPPLAQPAGARVRFPRGA